MLRVMTVLKITQIQTAKWKSHNRTDKNRDTVKIVSNKCSKTQQANLWTEQDTE